MPFIEMMLGGTDTLAHFDGGGDSLIKNGDGTMQLGSFSAYSETILGLIGGLALS